MKYTYIIYIFFPDSYNASVFCACETEADAQEIILSLEQNAEYDSYTFWLEYDKYIRPDSYFYYANHAYYQKLITV